MGSLAFLFCQHLGTFWGFTPTANCKPFTTKTRFFAHLLKAFMAVRVNVGPQASLRCPPDLHNQWRSQARARANIIHFLSDTFLS